MNLPRFLEPEVMDTMQEAMDYDEMGHSEVNRIFVHDLLEAGELDGEVLDLGTGTAQIPVELCLRCDSCYVMAVDMSTNMLDVARYNVELASLIERIQLDLADAKKLVHENDRFVAVISNSIIHHIPEPAEVLAESVRVVQPGGLLFFRDLVRPDSEEDLRRLVETHASQENQRQQELFADSLRASLRVAEVRDLVAECGFDPETVQMTTDRHWTWSARKPMSV